tara:strand:+ start:439 stop:612 length:174 start_codon:yes stop_codon:yes gene_type:complete
MAYPTNPIYKLKNDKNTGQLVTIMKEGVKFIPLDETNKDYQEYLDWVAEGNTAEAAD